MPNILVIGFDPHTIPGFDPAPVAAAIEQGSKAFAELGLTEDLFLIDFAELDGRAQAKLVDKLRNKQYDAVVVGGGVRKGPGLLELFQNVVNLVHWHQPDAAIAFNDNAGDSPDWVLKALEQRRNRSRRAASFESVPNVLVIGFDPDTIPGFEPGVVAAQLDVGSRRFAELGMAEEQCLIGFGELDGVEVIVGKLQKKQYDVVVVGGGIRKPPELLELFQTVVNLVHRLQPQAAIAFNSGPTDSADWALKALRQRR